ncbi:MAG: hypothetical protein ACQESF_05030 [Nanobdellota archaeon]
MAEKRLIVENLQVDYEGLFKLNDLYLVMEHWLKERGYDKNEKKNYEQVLKDGRDIMVEFWGDKKFSDYASGQIQIIIHVKKMKDIMVKKDGVEVPMNQGKIKITFNGYLFTDYMGKWEGKPLFYFLRMCFDRWIYSTNTNKFEGAVSEEVEHLYKTAKGHLNMYRY